MVKAFKTAQQDIKQVIQLSTNSKQIAKFPLANLYTTLSLLLFSLTSNLNMSSLLKVTDLFQECLIHFEGFKRQIVSIFCTFLQTLAVSKLVADWMKPILPYPLFYLFDNSKFLLSDNVVLLRWILVFFTTRVILSHLNSQMFNWKAHICTQQAQNAWASCPCCALWGWWLEGKGGVSKMQCI